MPIGSYDAYQRAGLELFERFGGVVHGLTWQSFHRHQLGRVYAIWHHRKAAAGVVKPSGAYPKLPDDADWAAFLSKNPQIEAIT